jgi:putative copper export protein
MNMQIILPVFVTFLHDLFTAIWIGGLIVLGVTVLPAFRKQKQQSKELANAIQKRLNTLVLVSILGLWITGILLANRSTAFMGLFNTSNAYSFAMAIKHIFVIIMTVLALARTLMIVRTNKLSTPSTEKRGTIILVCNIILGIAVLILSAYTATLANLPFS